MQKNYELLYIVHPDLEGSSEKVTEKVAGFITKAGGKVTSQDDWGKRKLAYPIAKNDFGVYVLVIFELETTKLTEVERDLRLSEEIMRSMITIIPVISEYQLARKKPRLKKEEVAVAKEKKEEPANIIVSSEIKNEKVKIKKAETKETEAPEAEVEEKPKKVARKKAEVAEEVVEAPKAEEKPKKPTTRSTSSVSEKKTAEKEEKERLAKLDEKLDELLK